jgi:acyl carrier protein
MPNIQLSDFLEQFAAIFDKTPETIDPGTKFKELEEWDSMKALTLIAMADEEFNLKIRGEDIRNSATVQELFENITQ